MNSDNENIKKLKAVAITKIKGTNNMPKVVASGYGSIAQRIIDIAKKHNIDIEENPDSEIIKWEIGGAIPDLTYAVVSEMLTFVYKLNEESKKQ